MSRVEAFATGIKIESSNMQPAMEKLFDFIRLNKYSNGAVPAWSVSEVASHYQNSDKVLI